VCDNPDVSYKIINIGWRPQIKFKIFWSCEHYQSVRSPRCFKDHLSVPIVMRALQNLGPPEIVLNNASLTCARFSFLDTAVQNVSVNMIGIPCLWRETVSLCNIQYSVWKIAVLNATCLRSCLSSCQFLRRVCDVMHRNHLLRSYFISVMFNPRSWTDFQGYRDMHYKTR
jgi:hypothetical protein